MLAFRAQLAFDDNMRPPPRAASVRERRDQQRPVISLGSEPIRPFAGIGDEGAGFELKLPIARVTLRPGWRTGACGKGGSYYQGKQGAAHEHALPAPRGENMTRPPIPLSNDPAF